MSGKRGSVGERVGTMKFTVDDPSRVWEIHGTNVVEQANERPWRERLFTRPWRPWHNAMIETARVQVDEVSVDDETGCATVTGTIVNSLRTSTGRHRFR